MKLSSVLAIFTAFVSLIFTALVWADDDNANIAFTDQGQGKALVLIHAFPTDQRLWQPQRQGLQPYFRVVTLDLWGFGKSAGKTTISMNDYADEVKKLLDKLNIQKAIIGGESMGGYVTLAFLKRYPERVSGIILSDTQTIADTREQRNKREIAANDILKNGSAQFIANFMPVALSDKAPQQTRTFLFNMANEQTPAAMAAALRALETREDTSSTLHATSLPVLIITGEKDTLISPEQSQRMHQLAKNSTLIVIAEAKHLSNLDKPHDWNQAVMNQFYP